MYISKIYQNLETANNNIVWVINSLISIITSGGVTGADYTKIIQDSILDLNNTIYVLQNIIGANPSTKYIGDNGSVSGNTYCTGAWGSNSNKYMACLSGIDQTTGAAISCNKVAGGQNWSFYCYQNLYQLAYNYAVILNAKNGPKNGNFCSAEDPSGFYMTQLNSVKNTIIQMINNIKPAIAALQGIQYSSYSAYSKLSNPATTKLSSNTIGNAILYYGDNGSVSGNTYCAGHWGNGSTNKNMKCLYGIENSTGKQISCTQTGVAANYYCLPANYNS